MAQRIKAPITGSVLKWAIQESGLSRSDIAAKLKTSEEELEQWQREDSLPSLSQVQRLAQVLQRPSASFFLPSPPKIPTLKLEFRAASSANRNTPNAAELRAFRDVSRLQELLGWLGQELDLKTAVPTGSGKDTPETVGRKLRDWTGIGIDAQEKWKSGSKAFRAWRTAFEQRNVYVLALSLGAKSVRGFSVWDDHAPVIAVNTAWNHQARSYTLFHELAHLYTRHGAACLGNVNPRLDQQQRIERWCEKVAASALLPQERFNAVARQAFSRDESLSAQLSAAAGIAELFSVSLRATCLRLIELGHATWALFEAIPNSSDSKEQGFARGGRPRAQIREDQLGSRTKATLKSGINAELITKADALTYFDVEAEHFSDEPVEA